MEIQDVIVDTLIEYSFNNRIHEEHQVDRIANSIREFGFNQPVVVDEDNIILVGHGRVAAAKKLGLKTVPVLRREGLSDAQKRAYRILDNKLQNDSEWHVENLQLELDRLLADNYPIETWGLTDLTELYEEEATEVKDDEFNPEDHVSGIVKSGDVIELGRHRVVCGDSTSVADVELLMDGAMASLCFTSPPYALGNSVKLSGNKAMSAKGNAYDSHEDTSDEWASLMSGWFEASRKAVAGGWVINVQMLAGNKRDLVRFISDRASNLVDIITWDKGNAAPQMAKGVLTSSFEWMIVLSPQKDASRTIPLSSWHGNVKSVYAGPPQRQNDFAAVHAATMPIHVPAWVLGTLCDMSESVYEPFAGTGTTLIAAEQLGRKCYAMEISPSYCDVIIRRYADFLNKTGQRPSIKINGEEIDLAMLEDERA